jgi:hypothetical protein
LSDLVWTVDATMVLETIAALLHRRHAGDAPVRDRRLGRAPNDFLPPLSG